MRPGLLRASPRPFQRAPRTARSTASVMVAAIAPLLGPVRAQECPLVGPSPGFRYAERLSVEPSAAFGGVVYAPDGRLIVYETGTGEVRALSAGSSMMLAKFEPFVYGSFLVLAPSGDSVLFGESSGGDIHGIPLAGGEAAVVDHIPLAFDLAFDSLGRGFVSAPGSSQENSIRLLDQDPGFESKEVVVNLIGYSGPVAVDPEGNLYYGTVNSSSLSGQAIIRFGKDLIDAAIQGGPLEEADGEILIDEIGGIYGLKYAGGQFLYTDLGFSGGTGGLYLADLAQPMAVRIAAFCVPGGVLSPSILAFRQGPRAFDVGAGQKGGSAAVAFSDFGTVSKVGEFIPELYFVRGRVNGDEIVDLSDAVTILSYLFSGTEVPEDLEAADVNFDGETDLSDAIFLLDYLFRGGPVIPPPFPDRGPAA